MGPRPSRGSHGGDPAFFEELTENLTNYAAKRFELSKFVQGVPLLDHLEQVYEATGEFPDEAELPETSSYELYIWGKYLSLHHGRAYGINGPCPISYQDILAWTSIMRESLEPWEVEVIMMIDRKFLEFVQEK